MDSETNKLDKHPLNEKMPLESEHKVVNKVITGTATRRKKNWLDKLAQTFFNDDAKNVGVYLVQDVLIPAFKDTVVEAIKSGLEMLFYGDTRPSNRNSRDRGTFIGYNRMFDQNRDRRPERGLRARSSSRVEEIILDTRTDANQVLSDLVDLIQDYGSASVADFYDLIGVNGDFTDNKFGWETLRDAYIKRVHEGYIVMLPPAIPLR